MSEPQYSHPLDKAVRYALKGGLPLFLFIFALVAGIIALQMTPREEEPQIVVPMIEVMVDVPNLTARQVERQVTTSLEKLLTQISGVEHVYSTSLDGKLSVVLRFFVGENRENALLNTYNKLYANQNIIPAVVTNWLLKPVEVDDVPIITLGLVSSNESLYNDVALHRIAQEVSTLLQGIENTSEVKVVGGRERKIQVELDITALAAHQTSALNVYQAIRQANQLRQSSAVVIGAKAVLIESGDVLRSIDELNNLVVNMINGKAVLLQDVARVHDAQATVTAYQWLEYSHQATLASQSDDNAKAEDQALSQQTNPMVTISVAKQKGTNAVRVAADVLAKMAELKTEFLPAEVHYKILRDYGETANQKVNDLTSSLAFAVFTVVVFIAIFLGWRAAIVVGLAVPVCYGLTLMLDLMLGYSINRVTLFALILSLGLLVDDPITGIDNISRFLNAPKGKHKGNKAERIVTAMAEIRSPLIMSTITIILAFVPLAFITGMMGPYMAPMAFNVPISVTLSGFVAFLITPWLASRILKPSELIEEPSESFYDRMLSPLIATKKRAKLGLWIVLVLFIAASLLPLLRGVPLKLLPFDNKNEIQLLIDLPESSTLETSAALTQQVMDIASTLPEIELLAAYVGEASPMDFNGMVRQYYQRNAPNQAEVRLILVDKETREHQSHAVVLRLRELLAPLQRHDTHIKVVEVPPGPPVLSTLVAEVYAEPFVDLATQQHAAHVLMQRLAKEPYVVEIDSSMTAPQDIARFVVDKQKAALSGIATADVNQTINLAVQGLSAGVFQRDNEATPLEIELKLPFSTANQISDLAGLPLIGMQGIAQQDAGVGLQAAPQPIVNLAELGKWQTVEVSQPILHKDLRPVIYVTAELSGRTPAEVIADISSDRIVSQESALIARTNAAMANQEANTDWQSRTYLSSGAGINWAVPEGVNIDFAGEGEWKITIDVFRDMGIAFAFALVGIFFVLRWQTNSSGLSLIIMSAIPLTIIGIMPGFWLMNQFGERWIGGAPDPVLFTATAMIGMIALAGIVVRNSLILVEFITLARSQGHSIKQALLAAGTVRMRPVLLTAGTTLLGNVVIILDPVFSGLALAIIFGIIASTFFSLLVVPMVYFLVFDKEAKPTDSVDTPPTSLNLNSTQENPA
ncbi:efflux RND transporter permease subunit [Paraglaciecola hydrolytica]|uniref:efflux RND transporter permease subunit n=1 Tax=Paraglaciecola hydrolytica TaxID=1799789 RepID=UPI0008389BB4|nr:efflux RND transporter permease subunit [Paraglaciecola hydrolytica]